MTTTLTILALVAAAAGSAPQQQRPTLALLTPAAPGCSARVASALAQAAADSLASLDTVAFLPLGATEERRAQLEREGLHCDVEAPCLAELARRLLVAQVLALEVQPRGAACAARWRLVDAQRGVAEREVEELLPTNLAGLAQAGRRGALRTVAPGRCRGALALIAPAGGALALDGRAVGTAPLLGPLVDLPTGTHAVQLRRADGANLERLVEVRFEELGVVDLRGELQAQAEVAYRPLPPPEVLAGSPSAVAAQGRSVEPLPRWPLWGGAGAALTAVALAGLAGLTWYLAVAANQRALAWAIREHAGAPPADAAGLDANYREPLAQSATLQLVTTLVGGGAAVLTAAACGLLGYGVVLEALPAKASGSP